ncbi:hypothetical protein [Vibrio vulnificus]|uniref:hypothetical protein n=1 Tax=Vibrio vulnificus TaxID=672 RepID=UPI003D9C8275
MKSTTPMQRLKHYINILLQRTGNYYCTRLEAREAKTNSPYNDFGFDKQRIVGDHVILFTHKDDHKAYHRHKRGEITKFSYKHPSMGLTFEYLGSDKPLIQFSFQDANALNQVHYSIPFDVEHFKQIIKIALNNDLFNEDLIYHLKEVFLAGKMDESLKAKITEQNDEYENECRSFGEHIDTELKKAAALAISFNKAKQTALKELSEVAQEVERSEEYALVKQLKAQLKDAELKLEDKKSSLIKERPSLVESQNLISELQDPDNGIAFKIYSIYQGIAEKILAENGLTKSARLSKFKGLKNKVFELLNQTSLHLPNKWKVKISEIEVQVKNSK